MRVAVCAALLVLALVSVAEAEAWVAWIIRTDDPTKSRVFAAYETKAECDKAISGQEKPGPQGTLAALIYMRCYPATVDPRPR